MYHGFAIFKIYINIFGRIWGKSCCQHETLKNLSSYQISLKFDIMLSHGLASNKWDCFGGFCTCKTENIQRVTLARKQYSCFALQRANRLLYFLHCLFLTSTPFKLHGSSGISYFKNCVNFVFVGSVA